MPSLKAALIFTNGCHFSGSASSGKIASTGHSGSHAPQSMHSSGSMMSIRSNSWMQSTGQTSTQERSLMSMQGSAMMYVTPASLATCARGTPRLPAGGRGRDGDADERASARPFLEGELGVQARRSLGQPVEDGPTPLAGAVVRDHELGAAARSRRDADRHPRRRPAPHGLVERFAHDLVEADAGRLAERVAGRDVGLDRDAPPRGNALGEQADGGREALLGQGVRLEARHELAQVAARLAHELERAVDDRARALALAGRERRGGRVEDLRHGRQVLDGPVVDQLCDAPALLLLGEEPLVERRPVAGPGAQSIIASRSAMATAWVRVSA